MDAGVQAAVELIETDVTSELDGHGGADNPTDVHGEATFEPVLGKESAKVSPFAVAATDESMSFGRRLASGWPNF